MPFKGLYHTTKKQFQPNIARFVSLETCETSEFMKHTITSALPYANGPLHLGHLSGAYLPADIYARFLRLQGKEVAFICGSDEHGAAITVRAKKEGRSPKDIIDTYHYLNKDTFERLGISFDIYHRTSEPLHHETALEFFKTLIDKGGEFDVIESEQYYDEQFGQFLADRFIVGTCPKCGHHEAYGDQCENCGSDLSPTELINPRSTLSGASPILRKTSHWYFKLDKHEAWLKEWIKEGKLPDGVQHHDPRLWREHVKGQCLSWIDGGLHPRSITRDLDWGIPIESVVGEAGKGKVLYVWFDAPIGYISATKQLKGDAWKDWWMGDDVELTHFIGKDNIVFHCIIFPSMLKAHGQYALPKNVPANQFLNFEGRKFSKSKGWGIEQHEYLEEFKDFPNREDALRYYLISTMPEQGDGDFKWDDFIAAHDNVLVANIGNFVNRVLVLADKYFEGKLPDFDPNLNIKGINETDASSFNILNQEVLSPLLERLAFEIERFEFKNAIKTVMEISSVGNAVLQFNAPWNLYKNDPDSPVIKASMSAALQITTILSVITQPFTPFTASKLRRFLNLPALQNGDFKTLNEKVANAEYLFEPNHQIGKPELLFAKINDPKDTSRLETINRQKEKTKAILQKEMEEQAIKDAEAKALAAQAGKTNIEFADFEKMDLRTGTIIAAEKVEKADKLLKLTVDLGFEQRTVVSGIALYYSPETVIGQQVLLLANLAPRKLRGIESQGMILMAEDKDGKLSFVSPAQGWPNGMSVK